ncbi:unnamed protein product [Tenebrio molitor]|nr:unnamed protein product [Tenebrio molitor]
MKTPIQMKTLKLRLNLKRKTELEGQNITVISDDPGLWTELITSEISRILVKSKPVQLKEHNFPMANTQ